MTNNVYYPAVFHKENEYYWVEFPDLPGCFSQGDTLENAYILAYDALSTYLDTSEDIYNQDFKQPSNIDEIIKRYPNETVMLVTFNSLQYFKLINSKPVKKTLTIPKWLNDTALKNNVNFSKTLQEALIKKLHLD